MLYSGLSRTERRSLLAQASPFCCIDRFRDNESSRRPSPRRQTVAVRADLPVRQENGDRLFCLNSLQAFSK